MRILLINKNYFPKSGVERYLFSLQDMLESAGHETVPFSMAHPENVRSPYEKYFVSQVDLERVRFNRGALKAAGRIVYSFEAARRLKALIRKTKPDVAHLHNIYHQLSPSILSVLKEEKIPTVQTLHDYAYLSPSYGLFDRGAVCERVKFRRYWRAIFHRCVKNSFSASALEAFAYSFHAAMGLDERMVGRLIAPSQFVKDKFAEWRRNAMKIEVVPHFIDSSLYEPEFAPGEEIAYAGRLSEEKGIGTLVAAMEKIPDVRLKIIGAGPMEGKLRDFCRLAELKNVRFLGKMDHPSLMRELARSRLVVVPSLSYETFGYPVIEAGALGKPVVASRIGALAENVIDGQTGILVKPGSAKDLAAAIAKLSSDEPALRAMGRAGRENCEEKYRPERHYARIVEIYDSVIGEKAYVKR